MTDINAALIIRRLEAKLQRQKDAAQNTELHIDALKAVMKAQDQANTTKPVR